MFVVLIFSTSVKAVELQWVVIQHKEINIPIFFLFFPGKNL